MDFVQKQGESRGEKDASSVEYQNRKSSRNPNPSPLTGQSQHIQEPASHQSVQKKQTSQVQMGEKTSSSRNPPLQTLLLFLAKEFKEASASSVNPWRFSQEPAAVSTTPATMVRYSRPIPLGPLHTVTAPEEAKSIVAMLLEGSRYLNDLENEDDDSR